MAAASMAFNIPLQNWLFHSADEVVRYHAVTDLYNGGNNALYFTFDTLEVDYARRSSVTVTREVTRSMGRHRYRGTEAISFLCSSCIYRFIAPS